MAVDTKMILIPVILHNDNSCYMTYFNFKDTVMSIFDVQQCDLLKIFLYSDAAVHA